MIIVERADPRTPAARLMLEQSHALMRSLFPPEENYFLDIDALCNDDVVFLTARIGESVLGTGALQLKDGYAEIKSMFVAEAARGQGIADSLMRALEDEARTAKTKLVRLETGGPLAAAVKLYQRHGYTRCNAFGDYAENTSSIFMEKVL